MTLIEKVCSKQARLIMFDLDGTLIDSVPDLAFAVDCMLVDLQREKAGQDKVRHWVGNGAAMLVKRALSNKMIPKKVDGELFQQAYQSFLDHYQDVGGRQSKLYPHVSKTLKQLREHYPYLAVITNKPEQFTPALLKAHDLPEFDLILCGDSLPEKKPHPAPLLHCMNTLGCHVSESIMVGDSLSDIKAAKAAGVAVICVEYGYHQGEDLSSYQPEALISSFDELVK